MCGDMADFTIENGMLSDWEDGSDAHDFLPNVRCRYCGKRYLHWIITEDKTWRLFDDKLKMYSCENYFDPTLLHKHL